MLPKTLEEICDLFDCQVIEDQYEDRQGNSKRCFVLGDPGDMSVGIQPYNLTPYFDSREDLRTYVESDTGRETINQQAAKTFPDDWDVDEQDWIDTGPGPIERDWFNLDELGRPLAD